MTKPFFVFPKNGFTFSYTQPECMDSKKTWRIKGIPFKDCEMKTIACRIMGLNYEQTGKCLHRSPHTVHTYIGNIHSKLDVKCAQQLTAAAINAGFDQQGNYNGQPVLTPDELAAAKKLLKEEG